jgi:FimV-like protein
VSHSDAALRGFFRAGLLLAGALAVFVALFFVQSRREPPVPAPKDEVLDRLAEDKRRAMRDNFARSLKAQQDARESVEAPLSLGPRTPTPTPEGKDAVVAGDGAKAGPTGEAGEAGSMDPDVMKAIALIDNGQVNEAVAALEAIVKKDPKNEQALVELAMIHLLDMKDPEQAIGYLQKAVVVAPGNQVVMSELVSLYDEQQRLEDGVAFLQDVEKQNPGSPDVAYGLGQMLSLAGRDAESIPYLERAAQQGDPIRAYRDLAEAYSRTGDSERAVDSYDKSLQSMEKELDSKRAQGLPAAYVEERIHYTKLDKARELIRMNDFDGAQRLLDEVGQQMPGDEGVAALQQNLNQKRAG